MDGIVIGGGDDIGPELYGGELVTTARLDPERDALERGLVHDARALNMPVLGICRGAQMPNVALGGTLHADAYGRYTDSPKYNTILPRKEVHMQPGTFLAQIAGLDAMRVNALHS